MIPLSCMRPAISTLFLLASIGSIPVVSAQEAVVVSQSWCDAASEHRLEIEVPPQVETIPGYERLSIHLEPARKKPIDAAMEGGYWNYEGLGENKFARCIPKDECFRVQVQLFVLKPYDSNEPRYLMDDNDVTIRLDGEPVPLSPAYPYTGDGSFVVAEVGDCGVECFPGTTLLEIEGTPNMHHSFGWRLEETSSGDTLVSCFGSWSPSNSEECDWNLAEYFHPKVCVPTSGCYRLVAGSAYSNSHEAEVVDHFNATFGGERLAAWSNTQFQALDFASEASFAQCHNHGPCEDDSEDLVEFFLWRDYNRTWQEENPDLEWALKSTSSGAVALAEGVVSKPTEVYDLTYERQCVPRDACYQLEFGVSPTLNVTEDFLGNKTSVPYWEEELYQVVMNGKIYNSYAEYTFGANPYAGLPNEELEDVRFRENVFLGECQASDVCSEDQQSLLEINFSTAGEKDIWLPYQSGWSLRDTRNSKKHEDGYLDWFHVEDLLQTTMYEYHRDQTYRHYQCVALQGTCTEFGVDPEAIYAGSVDESYSLLLDGQGKTERRDWRACEQHHCGRAVVTRIGGDSCPSSIQLAPGAIAGIVLSSIGAVGILVFFYFTRCRGARDTSVLRESSRGDVEKAETTTPITEEESPEALIPAESEELPYITC